MPLWPVAGPARCDALRVLPKGFPEEPFRVAPAPVRRLFSFPFGDDISLVIERSGGLDRVSSHKEN
jgi:hypothetical protein